MNSWLEKILFALFPILISGVMYLFNTVVTLQEDMAQVKLEAALARQQVKDDLEDDIHALDKRVAVIESKR
jgi:hypothetical protein